METIQFWSPGDILSAEKLNQHLQESKVIIIESIIEQSRRKLNKTAGELFSLIEQGYTIYCKGIGFLLSSSKILNNNINFYTFSFYTNSNISYGSVENQYPVNDLPI